MFMATDRFQPMADMKERVESLSAQVLRAAIAPAPTTDGMQERPVFLMGPTSELGRIHGQDIIEGCGRVIAAITDAPNDATICSLPRWTSEEFLLRAKQYPNAIALDFAANLDARGWVAFLCNQTGVERRDCVVAQAQLGLLAVYDEVTIGCMIERTTSLTNTGDVRRPTFPNQRKNSW